MRTAKAEIVKINSETNTICVRLPNTDRRFLRPHWPLTEEMIGRTVELEVTGSAGHETYRFLSLIDQDFPTGGPASNYKVQHGCHDCIYRIEYSEGEGEVYGAFIACGHGVPKEELERWILGNAAGDLFIHESRRMSDWCINHDVEPSGTCRFYRRTQRRDR